MCTCLALAKMHPAHWVIVLHLGLEGCSQTRELWFIDILICRRYVYTCMSHHIEDLLEEADVVVYMYIGASDIVMGRTCTCTMYGRRQKTTVVIKCCRNARHGTENVVKRRCENGRHRA